MVVLMFLLGFIADPILNIYMNPYGSLTGKESIWDELQVVEDLESPISSWFAHFAKGFVSMGVVGFLKTMLLNPWNWMNLRLGGSMSTRTTTQSGRDRTVNISWIALVVGIFTAFVFFYRWVETFVQRSLVRIGNNIVDTQLPGDDDDLKPPPGWKHQTAGPATANTTETSQKEPVSVHGAESNNSVLDTSIPKLATNSGLVDDAEDTKQAESPFLRVLTPVSTSSWTPVSVVADDNGESSSLPGVHRQGWSFSNL